jgi:D-alanyl-D-alanine carboxypeptidase/D-alanyl-D-alanine-endopeptidase (penicillin-binding protein 4)
VARRRRPLLWAALLTVVVVLAGVVAVVVAVRKADPVRRAGAEPSAAPSRAFPVQALLATPSPALAPVSSTAPEPSAAGLATALRASLSDRRLGRSISVSVLDAATGRALVDRQAGTPVPTASTAKLVTAAAALTALGPDHRLTTRVLAGAGPGDVVLVGGGDPTLAAGSTPAYAGAARLDQLAAAVRAAHPAPITRVWTDARLFDGPTTAPGWDSDSVSAGFAAPITALMVDGGRLNPRRPARSLTPDLDAGRALARALGARTVARGAAPRSAAVLATVSSAPLSTVVEQMLTASDNVLAEALNRQVALARHRPASFAGAAAAVKGVLAELHLRSAGDGLIDGSGLSRLDRVTPALLTSVLELSTQDSHPELRAIATGLPIAAYSGTLTKRFTHAPAAAGTVRAKTGTLSGVSSLAGEVVDADGRLLVFAVVASAVPAGGTLNAEAALDRVATVLAGCGCR